MTFNILVPDNVDKKAIDLLTTKNEFYVTAPGKMSREDTLAVVDSADALIIRSGTTADAELLARATNLKAIARAGVGVDNVDLDVATANGVVVMNTPDGNTISTAEHTFGLMLALARQIPKAHGRMASGGWDRKKFMGVELRGKTLGVVGFGRIGRALAKRAIAFEMDVVAYDPYVPADVAEDLGAKLVSMEELFTHSDFISLHTIVTDETHEMINATNILKMKNGVRIINAARGALINDSDLAEAIKSNKVGGAALDVYHKEPPPASNPLVGLENVVHTPHLAASTTDAQVQVGVDAVQQIIDGLTRGDFRNVVNPAVLEKVNS